MRRKIYLIQPTYRARDGRLFQGRLQALYSCAIPALAAAVPSHWERETCLEFFEDVDYASDASVVAISSMGYDVFHGREIAEAFRRRGKVVIFGGYQAHFSRGLLKDVADCIVTGYPGPRQMAGILAAVEAGSLLPEYDAGVDLDFPFEYSMLFRHRIVFMPILAGVGCRNRCDFCCTAARHGGEYRLRKLRYVLADLAVLRKRSRRFALVDSNIYNNRGYLLALCAAIERAGLGFQWGAEATPDLGEDDEALRALRRAGCRILFIGFESLSQRSLDAVRKPNDTAAYERAMANLRRHKFIVAAYFMLGLDGDTTETFDEVYAFIRRTGVHLPVINVLLPAPGTSVFERLGREGRLLVNTEEGFLRNSLFYSNSCNSCFFRPSGMTAEELEEGVIGLRKRLTTLPETVRRSVAYDPAASAFLLTTNVRFLRDSRRITAAWRARRSARQENPAGAAGGGGT